MDKNNSLLIQRIRDALNRHKLVVPIVHVSVANEPSWIEVPTGSVYVRMICWNIEDAGTEITSPEFEILHPDMTMEILERELPDFFPEITVIVDDDIDCDKEN